MSSAWSGPFRGTRWYGSAQARAGPAATVERPVISCGEVVRRLEDEVNKGVDTE
ncbi:hypothetical protein [Streptomyces triticisoli]|uniref:hypothetical protein n=1 Tax=Streptomyces triticisoli TaxID=2182797 RepID=UPI00130085CE|nr:hypothetical protein [Streptomyces triticisoli]